MIPKFDSMSDMLGFLRALPKNANYAAMLAKDFGYNVPTNAPSWQREYFFKYLVQGQFKGLKGVDLEKYAVDGTMKIKNQYYVDCKEPSSEVKVKVVQPAGQDGEVIFNTVLKKFEGYLGGRIVSRAVTAEKVQASMTKLHGVTKFNVRM
jgi:hypothetical protein